MQTAAPQLARAIVFVSPQVLAVTALVQSGKLDLDGLITHTASPENAQAAYTTAFTDPNCLKMVLAWRA